MKPETLEEWEARYIEKSGITKEFYDKNFATMPCDCEYEGCAGWIATNKVESRQYYMGEAQSSREED